MSSKREAIFLEARKRFHKRLLSSILQVSSSGIPSNADKDSRLSVDIAKNIISQLGEETIGIRLPGQTSGNQFESNCEIFLKDTFNHLAHLRPGTWEIKCIAGRNRLEIAKYEQYAHLIALQKAARKDAELAAALGSDYTITPDIVVLRHTEEDSQINFREILIDNSVTLNGSLRKSYNQLPILHASISCKWTMRSDRAQNARSEALNLIRNRKGNLAHIAVITGEPLTSRIASLALGTGDIDCVYHFALYELRNAVKGLAEVEDLLHIMVNGKRLKDISDLPLDLAV
jgi:hypothetical protein